MPLYARLWVDILGDPKLRMAVREGKKHLIVLPWFFAWAKRADAEGRIEIDGKPADPRVIADEIPNATPRLVAKSLQELADIGILTTEPDGCFRFRAWEFRNSGRASDSKEAIAERVRKHRATKRKDRNAPGNDSNALQGVTDVTTVTSQREERREKRGESKEEREEKKRSSTGRDPGATAKPSRALKAAVRSLPSDARDFLGRFWPQDSAPPELRIAKASEIVATLNGGAMFKRHRVQAGSPERLAAKCREVLSDPPRDPAKAMAVLLTKLADVSDASPTEAAAVEQKQLERREETDVAQRLADAFAWLADNPTVAAEVDRDIDGILDAQTPKPAGKMREMTRRMMHRSAVLKRWTDAGEPHVAAVGGQSS